MILSTFSRILQFEEPSLVCFPVGQEPRIHPIKVSKRGYIRNKKENKNAKFRERSLFRTSHGDERVFRENQRKNESSHSSNKRQRSAIKHK
jgi:hypothetical protein